MMKWYEQKYVNHRDWILDHLQVLKLSPAEFEMVMLIDFMNEHGMSITYEDLKQKTGMSSAEADHAIGLLCSRGYLEILASPNSVRFVLNGLFETDTARAASVMDSSLFDLFETEFGRPLSQNEMAKISEWNSSTDKQLIIYALREASMKQKLAIPYIDKIIQTWKKKGITSEMAGNGTH